MDRSSQSRHWLGRLAAVIVAACTTSVPAQTSLALSSLTVPDKNLPSGCRLRPFVPATTPVAQAGATTTIASNQRSSWPFPDNPWQGGDRKLLVDLRQRMDGPLRLPDAPPPTASELSAWEHKWVQHVLEGYRALYDSADDSVVDVAAIKFDDARLVNESAAVAGSRRAIPALNDRWTIGAILVHVVATARTECFQSVHAYLRTLK